MFRTHEMLKYKGMIGPLLSYIILWYFVNCKGRHEYTGAGILNPTTLEN